MSRLRRRCIPVALAGLWMGLTLTGCGTTRWSDTARTATEQMLLSDAIDRTIQDIDIRALEGQKVFFDADFVEDGVHRKYLVSSLRHHMLRHGLLLQEKRDAADYVVEARSGVVGTDRHEVLLGVPQMNLPVVVPGMPSQLPEIPLVKNTKQEGIAKIALFAYDRNTGAQVWDSRMLMADSEANNTWIFGAGPIQRGEYREGTQFAGGAVPLPGLAKKHEPAGTATISPASLPPLAPPSDAIENATLNLPPDPSDPGRQ